MTLKIFNFIHAPNLQVLTQLREVFDSLLIFFSLLQELGPISLNLLFVENDSLVLFAILGLPHFFPLPIELVLWLLKHSLRRYALNTLIEARKISRHAHQRTDIRIGLISHSERIHLRRACCSELHRSLHLIVGTGFLQARRNLLLNWF